MNQARNKRNTSRSVFELKVEKHNGGGKQFYNEERHNFVLLLKHVPFLAVLVLLVGCKNKCRYNPILYSA
jgi:hypothetical protein